MKKEPASPCAGAAPEPRDAILIPMPRTVAFGGGARAVTRRGKPAVTVDHAAVQHAQGYVLRITEDGRVAIIAHDEAGAFYGLQTLAQLERLYAGTGALPVVHIEDWPDFPVRGVMLDIARDKVPTMDTLFRLVDMLAGLKFNQLQLYTEHTFAYRGHEDVWKDASPMTAAEIRALDAYCRERFVELVPNQNSFGHMGRWLKHRAYAALAETPEGLDLCPVDPSSILLLRGLYADLLPNFSSVHFNVGCDETWTLGKGRSKGEADRIGAGRVYLNFLKQIHQAVAEQGKTMEFWGDIIMKHPELIPELPRDVIAMEWGYEADHPFEGHGRKFAAAGIPFQVVPGTSSWNSLLGRTDNALENLRSAALNGRANGATGFLVTDWGDNGHWQFLPVSFAPFAYGAAVSWGYERNRDIPLARALDSHVFMDAAGVMGQAALDLGNAHLKTGVTIANRAVYYPLLIGARDDALRDGPLRNLTAESCAAATSAIEEALGRARKAAMARGDAGAILAEFETDAALAKVALRLGRERLVSGDAGISQVPVAAKAEIAGELERIMEHFRELWLLRSRPGGLQDSVGRMRDLVDVLRC